MKKEITIGLMLLCSISIAAQNLPEKIDGLMQDYVQSKDFNGTVLVVKNNTVIFKKGYGLRNIEAQLPNDEKGIYQVASLTKQFTAAVIMQLEQEQKLSLQDKLNKYFPQFPGGGQNSDPAFIEPYRWAI